MWFNAELDALLECNRYATPARVGAIQPNDVVPRQIEAHARHQVGFCDCIPEL